MGKLETFSIALSTQPPVFFPGQPVSGVVSVTLNDGMKMRNIRLKFEGKALVHWTERRGSKDNKRTIHFRNEQVYFSEKVVLWGNPAESDADSPTLPAGSYTFPFQFVLPHNIPFSFEGSVGFEGYVRYSCKATIDKPWKFDHETKVAFTVASFYDLNMVPQAMEPAPTVNGHKYHCCCCCKSGPITGTINAGKSGFVPGEKIFFQGEISNLANVKVNSWKVELVQRVAFSAYHGGGLKTRYSLQVLALHQIDEEIQPREEKQIYGQLDVPAVPPSELLHCDFIVIQYLVQLTVKPARSLNMEVSAPILIGNIPLRNEWSHIAAPQPAPGGLMPTMTMAVAPPPMGASAPPPSGIENEAFEMAPYSVPPNSVAPAPAYGSMDPTQMGAPFATNYNTNYGIGVPTALPAPSLPSAPVIPAPYPDMPPPSYNEAFGTGATLKDDEDNAHIRTDAYKPLYPTYTWNFEKKDE